MPAPIQPGAPVPFVAPSAPAPASAPPVTAPIDLFEAKPALAMHTVRKGNALDQSESIRSVFPTQLGEIATHDRFPTGFRLDGGSLRDQWMGVRRIAESDGTKGYEIIFWLSGDAVELFKKRFGERGAKGVNFPLFEGYPPEGHPEGRAYLKRTGAKWSPNPTEVLQVVDPGRSCVDFCTGNPEALRGLVRIRVYGEDAAASKALSEVQKNLGMGMLFAPPTEKSLELHKRTRLLGSVAPERLEALRWRQIDEVDTTALAQALEGAPAKDAIATADLANPDVQRRVKLSALLYEASPAKLLEWAAGNAWASAAPASSSQTLETALGQVGLNSYSERFKAALAGLMPDETRARALLAIAAVAAKSKDEARKLVARGDKEIGASAIDAALAAAGVSPSRIEGLRFEEVYPGYFTVIDPAQAEACYEAGARYLYSTLDTNERVWQTLTMGQKSSLTRMAEGMLVQGKSTNADFGTGGASSVFTRLVTESAIDGAQGGGYQYNFQDWGGSRPFKLILNRRILGRTDWYGYNGDNYGRSTGLTAENKGARIVGIIDQSYGQSNELCFAVGNDPSYVDFVVTDNQWRKDQLVAYLKGRGLHTVNGKPVEELVRVETRFFQLPEDDDVRHAARTAARGAASKAAESAVTTAIDAALGEVLTDAFRAQVKHAAAEAAGATIGQLIDSYLGYPVDNALQELLKSVIGDAAPKIDDALRQAAIGAGAVAGKAWVDQHNQWQQWNVEAAAYPVVQKTLQQALTATAGTCVSAGVLAEVQAQASSALAGKTLNVHAHNVTPTAHNRAQQLLEAALNERSAQIREAVYAAALAAAAPAAQTGAAGYAASTPGVDLAALDVAALVAPIVARVVDAHLKATLPSKIASIAQQNAGALADVDASALIDEAKKARLPTLIAQRLGPAAERWKTTTVSQLVQGAAIDLRNHAVGEAWKHWQSKQG